MASEHTLNIVIFTVIKCPTIEQPDDLEMICSNENFYASICLFSCKNDLHMIGLSELYCGDPGRLGVGRWNSDLPTCVPRKVDFYK